MPLTGVSFTGVHLTGVPFTRVPLTGLHLTGVHRTGVHLSHITRRAPLWLSHCGVARNGCLKGSQSVRLGLECLDGPG